MSTNQSKLAEYLPLFFLLFFGKQGAGSRKIVKTIDHDFKPLHKKRHEVQKMKTYQVQNSIS